MFLSSPISLALNRQRVASPSLESLVAALFSAGEQGAWYDPSDLTTLFQDSAGTLPVTEVEQPVGLMLDRRKGLALGSELITNAADREFSSDTGYWLLGAQGSISGGTFNVTAGSGTQISKTIAGMGLTQGKWYKVTYTITSLTSGSFRWQFSSAVTTRTAAGTYTEYWLPDGTTLQGFCGTNTTLSLDNISVKLLDGNHAYQTTSSARPHLRSRYNLLTYSEQFNQWTPTRILAFGSGSVANAATAPDGTTTADYIVPNTDNNSHTVYLTITATTGIFSCYVKQAGYSKVMLYDATTTLGRGFNLADGTDFVVSGISSTATYDIEDVGDGWYRCLINVTATTSPRIYILNDSGVSSFVGDTSKGLYVWGAQLNLGSTAMSYQRIAALPALSTPPTYATTSTMGGEVFRPYLWFDGSDDRMLVASNDGLNFGQGSFWAQAGLASRGASEFDVIWGKSALAGDNIRLFFDDSNNLRVFWGANNESYIGAISFTKEANQVVEWGVNSGASQVFYAVNAVQATAAITLSGTGSNTEPVTIGMNSFNTQYAARMDLYGMIIRKGTIPSAADLGNARRYMASKSGVTL